MRNTDIKTEESSQNSQDALKAASQPDTSRPDPQEREQNPNPEQDSPQERCQNPDPEQDSPQANPSPKKKKKKKVIYVDDGHTVYDMSNVVRKTDKKDGDAELSKRERRAAIFAALGYYLPRLLLVIGCFCAVGLLIYLWLH